MQATAGFARQRFTARDQNRLMPRSVASAELRRKDEAYPDARHRQVGIKDRNAVARSGLPANGAEVQENLRENKRLWKFAAFVAVSMRDKGSKSGPCGWPVC